jgi:hypothetical protein
MPPAIKAVAIFATGGSEPMPQHTPNATVSRSATVCTSRSAAGRVSASILAPTMAVAIYLLLAAASIPQPTPAWSRQPDAAPATKDAIAARLLAAYPEHIAALRDGQIIWRDGTTMPLDDGRGRKSHPEWLNAPDVADMFDQAYIPGPAAAPPAPDNDPGRARNTAFFAKIYGDCRAGTVKPNLVDVAWLPRTSGTKLKVTSVNGVAKRLTAVSRALDALPAKFDRYLIPPAGTYNCRTIAGTDRLSAHGFGIAIDIATKGANYWRWSKPGPNPRPVWRNRVPEEIVAIFEAHGFIWGGKWHHYDTMHFEFRPELLPPTAPLE